MTMNTKTMHTDKISLPELRFMAKHGVLAVEHHTAQEFVLGLTVEFDCRPAGASDELTAALDYRQLYRLAAAVMLGEHHDLLESLATDIARRVLLELPVTAVTVRLRKTAADLGGVLVPAEVEISRQAGDF